MNRSNDKSIVQHAELLGYALMLMLQNRKYSAFNIGTLKVWTQQAILHEQIHFFFDVYGKPVGYITWGLLAEDVEQRIVNDVCYLLHPSEWNEGHNLWILDFCFPAGIPTGLKKMLKTVIFKHHNNVQWVRFNKRHERIFSQYSIVRKLTQQLTNDA